MHLQQMQNTTQAAQQSAGMGGRVGQQGQGQHRTCTAVAAQTEPLYRQPPYGATGNADLSPQHRSIGANIVRAMVSTHDPFELLAGVDTEGWTAGADQQQPAQQTPPQQQPAQQQQEGAQGQQFAACLFKMMQRVSRGPGTESWSYWLCCV